MWEDLKLYGRERERIQVDRVLAAARSGRGSALVLSGDPAIGKTALLRAALDQATGFRVLRCEGIRAESGLDYAALHELLLPVADRLPLLPPAQARALGVVLGLDSGPAEAFLVGAALVRLLTELAAERPLLLIVDEARLVDPESARAIVFAIRRLTAAPVALLVALRDDPADTLWRDLPALARHRSVRRRVAPLARRAVRPAGRAATIPDPHPGRRKPAGPARIAGCGR
ncbi:ATP-binding protein [Nocardia tengchongensis]|uniref:ATP-binding protein n=1 Tax=Nocardia tengchongensis TaxID=2055889 RepID=A0ABX8CVZ9_9NOCA|nr:ATP-binding protein [Nocardia tengchongensis]QVI23669.1 ATP-binding protein [Nocardia tengchongensis]